MLERKRLWGIVWAMCAVLVAGCRGVPPARLWAISPKRMKWLVKQRGRLVLGGLVLAALGVLGYFGGFNRVDFVNGLTNPYGQ